jgi:hypothetical protein
MCRALCRYPNVRDLKLAETLFVASSSLAEKLTDLRDSVLLNPRAQKLDTGRQHLTASRPDPHAGNKFQSYSCIRYQEDVFKANYQDTV